MIGIIPAAGRATRMGGIPKFLLPIPRDGYLLDRMRVQMHMADNRTRMVDRVIVVGNPDNIELIIANVPGNTSTIEISSKTMAETLIAAHKLYDVDPIVLFGMPDTYVEDYQAFHKLCDAFADGADVAIGLFHTRHEQRSKLGMCGFDHDYKVTQVVDKPERTELIWAWGILAWKPVLWEYIKPEDTTVGYALQRAISAGLDVRAVPMEGAYYDCGTPDEYFALIRHLTEVRHAV